MGKLTTQFEKDEKQRIDQQGLIPAMIHAIEEGILGVREPLIPDQNMGDTVILERVAGEYTLTSVQIDRARQISQAYKKWLNDKFELSIS